jgi:hypothetical protein
VRVELHKFGLVTIQHVQLEAVGWQPCTETRNSQPHHIRAVLSHHRLSVLISWFPL